MSSGASKPGFRCRAREAAVEGGRKITTRPAGVTSRLSVALDLEKPSVLLHLSASRPHPQGAKALATSLSGGAGIPSNCRRPARCQRLYRSKGRVKTHPRVTHNRDRYLDRYLWRPVLGTSYNKVAEVAVELNSVRTRAYRAPGAATARVRVYSLLKINNFRYLCHNSLQLQGARGSGKGSGREAVPLP